MNKAEPLEEPTVDFEDRPSSRAADDRLNSWKEIASYLNRDVRTVRRWEKNQGLPVRRHQHQKAASVYAYRSEIDVWWKGEQARLAEQEAPALEEVVEAKNTKSPRKLWWIIGVAMTILVVAASAFLITKNTARRMADPPAKAMLVILPFQNLTGDRDQDFIGDGLTEEMTTQASGIAHDRLGVIARTSSMAYKDTRKPVSQIGKELGVDYVLEGSIRNSGDRIRITAQLIQVRDQTHIWAQDYDSDRHDVLKLESETAQAIAQQIDAHLLAPQFAIHPANQHAVDPEVYELYLQGRHYLDQRSRDALPKGLACFQQAIARDPQYAAAYAGLADAYNMTAFYGLDPTLNAVSQAKIAANKAMQIDNNVAAAHAAEGYTEFMWQGNWTAAEKEFQRALELDDNYVPAHQWYALYLAGNGRTDEAINQMQYAKRLDPVSPSAHAGLAYMYYFARNYNEAIESAHTALQLNPNSIPAHTVLGWTFIEQKKYSDAIEELQTAVKLSRNVPVYTSALVRAYALSGNVTEARAMLSKAEQVQSQPGGSGTAMAAARLSLGDTEAALHWLEKTAPGDIQANWLRVDPAFDALRKNPRFAAVVARIGTKTD